MATEILTQLQSQATEHAQQLLGFLAERKENLSPLLILTHDFPDPDALAAAYALQYLVREAFGISSFMAYGGEVGRTENKAMVRLLRIPIHKFRRPMLRQHQAVALVDTQPAFQNNELPPNFKPALILDQHASTTPPAADLAIVDPDCGATCVIVAQALLNTGLEIPARIATALAYGIITDTLNLYRVHRPDVVQTYLGVLHHCDMRTLARIQNPLRSRRFFATLGKGIREATMYRRLIVTHLGTVETPDLVSQIAEFLLAYMRARWTLVTGRYKGRLHASLRTNQTNVLAGEVLRAAFVRRSEAGGHGPIAGGSCRLGLTASEETWQEREQELQARVLKRLRISSKVEPRKPFQT